MIFLFDYEEEDKYIGKLSGLMDLTSLVEEQMPV